MNCTSPFPEHLILFDCKVLLSNKTKCSEKQYAVEFLKEIMRERAGTPQEGVLGPRMLLGALPQVQPQNINCWLIHDCPPEEIWRKQFYPDYHSDLDATANTTSDTFAKCLCIPQAEAKDTIAALVHLTAELPHVKTLCIVASGRDYHQLLVDPRVVLYEPIDMIDVAGGDTIQWTKCLKTPEDVMIDLDQMIFQGDKSANIRSASEMALAFGDGYAGYNFNARLIDFDYIPRSIIENVAAQLQFSGSINYCPRDIQLGLCCLNTILRKQNIFCSRKATLNTIQTKGYGELYQRCQANLYDLIRMINWNYQNGIRVFRISSELFPHYANPKINRYTLDQFQPLLTAAGRLARKYGQRLTFHPGQYNVVGTPDPVKFQNTAMELDYHAEVLDRLGCDTDSVMVIHGGGQYKDKAGTIARWIIQFRYLSPRAQRRLVLENCEKSFNIEDCLYISSQTGVPVVFDTHHYDCYRIIHPEVPLQPPAFYIPQILATWTHRKIKPKFHISEQGNGQTGNHSDYIQSIPEYLLEIPTKYATKIDIMVEAKMKEQAVFYLYNKYLNINPKGDTAGGHSRGTQQGDTACPPKPPRQAD